MLASLLKRHRSPEANQTLQPGTRNGIMEVSQMAPPIFGWVATSRWASAHILAFGRPFVKRFTLCYQTVVCLSVTFVNCGQTVGRIKIKCGVQVGLSPGHIVLDGDPAPPPPKGHSPHPIFGPYLLRPNTWHGRRPVLDGDPASLPQKGREAGSPSPIFGRFLLWPNGGASTKNTL